MRMLLFGWLVSPGSERETGNQLLRFLVRTFEGGNEAEGENGGENGGEIGAVGQARHVQLSRKPIFFNQITPTKDLIKI
jgi:hypothetical protein